MVDLTALGLSERTIQEIEEAEGKGTMALIVNRSFKDLERDGIVERVSAFVMGAMFMIIFILCKRLHSFQPLHGISQVCDGKGG